MFLPKNSLNSLNCSSFSINKSKDILKRIPINWTLSLKTYKLLKKLSRSVDSKISHTKIMSTSFFSVLKYSIKHLKEALKFFFNNLSPFSNLLEKKNCFVFVKTP